MYFPGLTQIQTFGALVDGKGEKNEYSAFFFLDLGTFKRTYIVPYRLPPTNSAIVGVSDGGNFNQTFRNALECSTTT